MATWNYSVGNLVGRAAVDPAAVSPATEDPLLPLVNLGDGFPDDLGSFAWRADGTYEVDFDLNLLADESARADAPTGWTDFLNMVAGTPGLPANPPDWGSYAARNPALRLFRPVVQLVEVMPGETLMLAMGIYWPLASAGATGVQVRVVDSWNGKGWNGAGWVTGGVLNSQTVGDTWLDFAEQIDAHPDRTERSTYLVIVEPIAAAYDATTAVYASANGAAGSPALFAAVDSCAIVGHNLPADATVTLDPQPSGTSITLTPVQPSMLATGVAEQLVQTWRLSIQMPTGNEPRPILGEVWIGLLRAWARSPQLPLELAEGDRGQVRVETDRGRVEVVAGSNAYPPMTFPMKWTVPDADYVQTRDEITRLTGFGKEPMLLIPSTVFEGGRFYHGRIGKDIGYGRITAAESLEHWRSFTLEFQESPFAAR